MKAIVHTKYGKPDVLEILGTGHAKGKIVVTMAKETEKIK